MKQRLLSLLLSLLVVLSLVPTAALADNRYEQYYQERNPHYSDIQVDNTHQKYAHGYADKKAEPTYCENDAEVAAAIRAGLVQRQDIIEVNVVRDSAVKQADISNYFYAALAETDSPEEGDYLTYQYESFGGGSSGYNREGKYYYTLTYTVDYYTTRAQEDAVTAKLRSLMPQFTALGGDYAKVQAIYRYITDSIVYDRDHLGDNDYLLQYTAYAGLIKGTCVCQGYALLLYRMLREAGIDCRIVEGFGNGGRHAWNIAKVDGKYYALDSTWDAGRNPWAYFLLSADNMNRDHQPDKKYITEPFSSMYPISGSNYVPAVVVASGDCGKNLKWTLDDSGKLIISGTGAMYDNAPSWQDKAIKTVIVGDGVTSLSEYVFYGCESITSVTLGRGLTVIPYAAFYECKALSSLTLGEGITSIANYAFARCESLATLYLPSTLENIGSNAINACGKLRDIYYNGTEKQWSRVEISGGNNGIDTASIHFAVSAISCDLNDDGNTDNADLTLLARHVAGIETITDAALCKEADVNGDGTVSAADLTALAEKLGA